MDATSPRWQAITDSEFPWERDALTFVRDRLHDHDPYRAWANFEFIADDGSINEVDLLVLTPKGFYLVEIKSRPGIVEGDQGTWTWRGGGRVHTVDNPLLLANRKAKKLISLLRRQPALQRKPSSPFLEAHVFLSHEDVDCRLAQDLRDRVHLRDTGAGRDERPGIVAALTRHSIGTPVRTQPDRPMAKAVSRAMQEAGIRPSQRARRVGDYRLDELLLEGPNYQDWTARHAAIDGERARVRIYAIAQSASDDERSALQRAARREYQILRGVRHEGILAAKGYTEHVLGPALVFEHRDGSERFDHWLTERAAKLDVDTRLHLLRQLAEALRYAHAKHLVHRALSPQSILVVDPEAAQPRVRIFNWQTGAREALDTGTTGPATSGASRLDPFVEETAWVYMAPEAVTERGPAGEQLDVFSLGAIAYHLFSGRPPASSLFELTERLRDEQGLRISSVLDGAGDRLQLLVQYATHPEVTTRLESVREFLEELERLEDELTRPEERSRPDPLDARPGDELDHGLVMQRRLGKGATALALLVERDGQEHVLKVALSPAHNDRLRAEAAVLGALRHQYIVEFHKVLTFKDRRGNDRVGLLMARAGDATLADRLREEGRLHLELLERFGEDLLTTIDWLEQKGIPHRDIKPENLGTAKIGNQLHLVLFDFSLARTPAENILAGTRHYLDPFLQTRKPPRWDTYAERFAAAVTLYQMAAGSLPRWGDGQSEPAVLDCEATIDADVFEPAVREEMTAFFEKALRRDYRARFRQRRGDAPRLAPALPRGDAAGDRHGPRRPDTASPRDRGGASRYPAQCAGPQRPWPECDRTNRRPHRRRPAAVPVDSGEPDARRRQSDAKRVDAPGPAVGRAIPRGGQDAEDRAHRRPRGASRRGGARERGRAASSASARRPNRAVEARHRSGGGPAGIARRRTGQDVAESERRGADARRHSRGGQPSGRAGAPALEQDLRADPAPARRSRDARGARERDDATGARRRHPRAPWLGAGGAAPLALRRGVRARRGRG